MSSFAALILFFSFGFVLQMSHGIEVNVTKDDKLCLYANLLLNFSVSYSTVDNKSEMAVFELPANAASDDSKCDAKNSTLKLKFGEGHSWTVTFSLNEKNYQADLVTFIYNLSDSTFFPNSSSNETVTVTKKPEITNVGLDTCYSCKSKDMMQVEKVNMTLWNMLVQAFVINGSKSENITSCAADNPTTPAAPTTTPVTSTTSAAPVTNTTSTSPPPTSTPTPTLPTPNIGNYSLGSGENTTACLLANFGLQIGFTQQKYQEANFNPSGVNASGFCGGNSSELLLVSEEITVKLTFVADAKKFRLHALNVTVNTSSGLFVEGNSNLSLWEAAVGSSYMCNKEQNYTINSLLSIYTFNLHVQPFEVKKGLFSTAEECFLDSDLSFLVPIAVGVALSFLIILVLISYLIGRRKSRTGYQSV
ncbi:lysosome-associated membrane glycoprotein 2 isoform X1 [Melanotaenia boesemani]|uniref:lysosome-associated membrane glycoprotein 2 isoform X1 n=1 Tax=Melanotaenia boesemani TaxID=1250792 RepID=UPI001C0496A2|nr:lysosome-associated membrane glycoprotein 2 isoform X1 [Melanotaenia boesemani]